MSGHVAKLTAAKPVLPAQQMPFPDQCKALSGHGLGVQTSVALSLLRFQLVLTQVKNIHFYAKDKATDNLINQSDKIRKRTQKLPGSPLTKIETFTWGCAGGFPADFCALGRSFWRTFIYVLKSGSCYLFSSRKHPTLGRWLRLCHRSCAESRGYVQEGLINKTYTPRICCFQGTSPPAKLC